MLRSFRAATLALLFTLVLVPGLAGAQRRLVSGTVLDRAGQPVEGAAVKLKNTITLRVRSYITQQDGRYRFYGLHPEMDYSIRARRDGQSSKSRDITRFETKQSIRIDLRLDTETSASE
jgi:protocatechuate 3,4-dioxygenase beta subunit